MYKSILFATDLTQETDCLIDKVKSIQRYTNATLSIVHVMEPLPTYSYAYIGIKEVEDNLMQEARTSIEKLGETLHVERSHLFIRIGASKSNILSIAEQLSADLIVCGSHGRHGLSLLLGSTANAILHGAKCDVLTVRLPE